MIVLKTPKNILKKKSTPKPEQCINLSKTHNLLELKGKFSKVTGYKVNILVYYVPAKSNQNLKLKRNNIIYNNTKNLEVLRCKSNKICVRSVYERLQNADKETKEEFKKWREIPCHVLEGLILRRQFSSVWSTQSQPKFQPAFCRYQAYSRMFMKRQGARIEDSHYLTLRLTTITRTVCYW